jgi:hypothetical protein
MVTDEAMRRNAVVSGLSGFVHEWLVVHAFRVMSPKVSFVLVRIRAGA